MDDLLPREKPAIVAAAYCAAQAVLGGLASPSPAPPYGMGVFMPQGQPGAFPGQQAPRGGMMYPPNMAGGRGGAGMGGAQGRGGRGAPQGVPGAVNGGRGVGGPMMGGVGQQGPRPVYGISSPRMMQQPGMPYGGPRPQFPFHAGGVAPYMQQQGVGPQGMPQMGGPDAYIPSPPYVPHQQQQQYEDQDNFSDEDDI
ncbi:hypothetical protein B484DRAFT_478723 [Ochromonadaceae sp. CCMP2298]|nr:hypothetical protein B484DRAFT_478723 [Ochromonadaceae sp. CCMP2298]